MQAVFIAVIGRRLVGGAGWRIEDPLFAVRNKGLASSGEFINLSHCRFETVAAARRGDSKVKLEVVRMSAFVDKIFRRFLRAADCN